MSNKKRDLMKEAELADEILNIPEDEIWTYRIEGLQAPRIVDKTIKTKTKIGIILVLIVAISLSIFFSLRAVSNKEYDFSPAENGFELVKYSNPGQTKEVTVAYADGDTTKPITEIHEYAFNCDEKLVTVNIGKDVEKIDGKSFYSCWNLECVFVDDANPFYCDIDGVLYDKALTEILYYPSAHNLYLTREAGYEISFPENGSVTNDDFCGAVKLLETCIDNDTDTASLSGDDAALLEKFNTVTGVSDYGKFISDYREKVGRYVLPSTVTSIGKLAFAYSDIEEIYIPEGIKSIGTLGFFKAEKLKEIYSYQTDDVISDTVYEKAAGKMRTYRSLPNGLETIGSDAFTYDRGITYLYLPASVREIGHHAFYNMAYKSGDTVEGVAQVNVEYGEAEFKENIKTGESWLPKIDAGLFEKNIPVEYASVRE